MNRNTINRVKVWGYILYYLKIVPQKTSSNILMFNCPFCETFSCHINWDNFEFFCHECNSRGDYNEFIECMMEEEDHEKLSYDNVLEIITKWEMVNDPNQLWLFPELYDNHPYPPLTSK